MISAITKARTPKDIQQVIGKFERRISDRIDELDQTVRDLLQIVSTLTIPANYISAHSVQEFAWVLMSETRISTRLGQNVMLLTYVSIFYLPLAFCAVSVSCFTLYDYNLAMQINSVCFYGAITDASIWTSRRSGPSQISLTAQL
jgi:hypothetical protein